MPSARGEAGPEHSPLLSSYELEEDLEAGAVAAAPTSNNTSETGPARAHAKQASLDAVRQQARRHNFAARFVAGLRANEGLVYVAGAQLLYSLMALSFKLLYTLPLPPGTAPISALQTIFFRMSITWLLCTAWMVLRGVPHPVLGPPEVRWLLALRGVSGYLGLFGLYYSLQYLSLSDATVLTFLAPLATALLAAVALGEPFSAREALAGVISLFGVILIARPAVLFGEMPDAVPVPVPEQLVDLASRALQVVGRDGAVQTSKGPTEAERLGAVVIALIGVLGSAGAYTTIRHIGRRATATHSVAAFSLYATVVSYVLAAALGETWRVPPSIRWMAVLLAIGVFGFFAQVLAALGLQREKAGRATLLVFTQALHSSVFQYFILGVPLHPLSLAGCAVILAAAAWVMLSPK